MDRLEQHRSNAAQRCALEDPDGHLAVDEVERELAVVVVPREAAVGEVLGSTVGPTRAVCWVLIVQSRGRVGNPRLETTVLTEDPVTLLEDIAEVCRRDVLEYLVHLDDIERLVGEG